MSDPIGDPTHHPVYEVTPRFVAASLAGEGEPIVLLDCREHDELAIARIDGAAHIPMGEIASRLDEIERMVDQRTVDGAEPRVVVSCHSGRRSLQVALMLREARFASAVSMAGGIDWWSRQIDPSVPRY
jgi:rhodanese-related sulfurtransferase